MSQILQNITQVIYQTPRVGEIYVGQLTAADVAQREAQLAKAKELEKKAKVVTPLEEAAPSFALKVDNAAKRLAARKERLKKELRQQKEELEEDDKLVVNVRI